MHYQETKFQVEETIQSLRLFAEAVKLEREGPFQNSPHSNKKVVTQSVLGDSPRKENTG